MRFFQELFKGFWKEIPPFRLVLGICPALAVSDLGNKALGMGLAVTFVLVCSNVIISALRNLIPPKVRIAMFIIIVATFVVIVEMVTHAFVYPLYKQLGIFIPLIVVNCIPLGRAEAFEFLRRAARSSRRKLADVAHDLIESRSCSPRKPRARLCSWAFCWA